MTAALPRFLRLAAQERACATTACKPPLARSPTAQLIGIEPQSGLLQWDGVAGRDTFPDEVRLLQYCVQARELARRCGAAGCLSALRLLTAALPFPLCHPGRRARVPG